MSSNRAAVRLLDEGRPEAGHEIGARFRLRRSADGAVGRAGFRRSDAEPDHRRLWRVRERRRDLSADADPQGRRRRRHCCCSKSRPQPQQAIRPVTAYLMADMLRGVIDGGTGYGVRQLRLHAPRRRQDRHHQRLQGRLVRRLHAVARDRRVGWLRPAADHSPQRLRRRARGADVDAVHEGRDQGPEGGWIARPRGAMRDARVNPPQTPEYRQADVEAEGETQEPAPAEQKKRGFWSKIFGGTMTAPRLGDS